MRDALVRQPLQLTVSTTRVLIAGAWLAQHRPDTLTAVMTNEHRQQLVGVQAIGLGAARAPVHLDARWVDDDVVHTELG